jgi:hypothetical protein
MPAPRRWRIERDATRTPSTSSSSTQVAHPRIAPGSGRRAEWKLAHLAVGVALHIDRAAATRAVERYRCSLCASRSIELSPTKFRLSRGNTEGTPARARTSMRDHSLWPNSSALRAFLVRRRPRLPSPPAPVLNGKEGVDGSSPSEGLHKSPANGPVVLPVMARFGFLRVRDGYILGLAATRGRARRLATQAGTCSRRSIAATDSESSCKQVIGVARAGATPTPSFASEGVIGIAR